MQSTPPRIRFAPIPPRYLRYRRDRMKKKRKGRNNIYSLHRCCWSTEMTQFCNPREKWCRNSVGYDAVLKGYNKQLKCLDILTYFAGEHFQQLQHAQTHLKSMSCRMLAAMMTLGFLPLFMEKMVRLEESSSVVFSVSAAVPAPQQLKQVLKKKENEHI